MTSELLGTDFIFRLLINTVATIILVRFCYFKFSRNRSNSSSFLLFGIGVFLVTALLHSADISMGFAFGLFAVFSMLRYRTESISIKEMTYLFLVISIALLSAVSTLQLVEIFALTLFICMLAFLLETSAVLPLMGELDVDYEKIENIHSENKQALIDDLQQRTGLHIHHVEILSIDFLKDAAQIRIHFLPETITSASQASSFDTSLN